MRRACIAVMLLAVSSATACKPGSTSHSSDSVRSSRSAIATPTRSPQELEHRADPCTSDSVVHLRVDVDGDGQDDRVYQRQDRVGTIKVGACTSGGARSEVAVIGMGEIFEAVRLGGRWEVFAGGTSAYSAGVEVLTFVNGRLHLVRRGRSELLLTEDVSPEKHRRYGYGCEDLNGDGRPELVQVTVDYRMRHVIRVGYDLRADRAQPVARRVTEIPARWSDPHQANASEFATACRTRSGL